MAVTPDMVLPFNNYVRDFYGGTEYMAKIDPYRKDIFAGAKEYAKLLTKAIQDVKKGNFDPGNQSEFIYNKFSWETAEKKWKEFHDSL